MLILGINAYHGDASACAVVDGEVVCAVEEERFTRAKHQAGFPAHAVRWCLAQVGADITDVDHVAISRNPLVNLHRKLWRVVVDRPSLASLRQRAGAQRRILGLREALAEACDVDPKRIRARLHRVEHHRAHLASAFYPSPFERAVALSLDGMGDFTSGMWAVGEGHRMRVLGAVRFPHSLGVFYTAFTQFLGLPKYGDEYKLMGLAAYGEPRFLDVLRRVVWVEGLGYRLDLSWFTHASQGVDMTWAEGTPTLGRLWSDRLVEAFGPPREPGGEVTGRDEDLAASVQARLEEVELELLRRLHAAVVGRGLDRAGGISAGGVSGRASVAGARPPAAGGATTTEGRATGGGFAAAGEGTPGGLAAAGEGTPGGLAAAGEGTSGVLTAQALDGRTATAVLERTDGMPLVLAGGVALNCTVNGMIRHHTPFEELWIQPAANDAGTSIGAALWVYHQVLGQPRRWRMTHAYLGPAYDTAAIDRALQQAGFDAEVVPDEGELVRRVARRIADGAIVGWYQGAMEFGPRALGNRSIVCDPRRPNMKDVLNARIKFREPFRPFAPSVLAEAVGEWFEDDYPSPFMLMTYRVHPERRAQVPAITHADGTGRLQTVDRDTNPRYHALISAFAELTDVPVVLNTSFNENEPIVNTPEEAVACFARTPMDVLVLGDRIVDRGTSAAA